MLLSDISIKRPVFASVMSIVLIIFGIVSFSRLSLRQYPDVDPPKVSVETLYRGASAETVETKITRELEDSISGIEAIDNIQSISEDGYSSIVIEFDSSRDVDLAANDVRDRVSRVLSELPAEAESPKISKVDSNTMPVIWIVLTSDELNLLELSDYADRYLKDRFSTLNGVANVVIGGERKYAMRVWLDPEKLAARNISVRDVEAALARENIELPAGRLESIDREFTVRIDRTYLQPEDFMRLVIAQGEDKYLVRLGDLGRAEIGAKDVRKELFSNGRATIGLGIVKQSKANTLEVARGVRRLVQELNPRMPHGSKLTISYDSAIFIEAAIHEVYTTLALTIVLVILVIYLFLGDIRATLVPAATIPVSLISAFIVLQFFGYSINILTLLGLILAIGLVVDDSIVVLENIYKRIEAGEPALRASFLGARQVGFAVIATTAVLVAVFLPISMMPGNIGRLFTEFAWAILGACIFSTFAALTISPMMCSKLLTKQKEPNAWSKALNAFIDRMLEPLERLVSWSIRCWPLIVSLCIALAAASLFLFTLIPREYAPVEDQGVMFLFVDSPDGATLKYTAERLEEIEDKVDILREKGILEQTVGVVPREPRDEGGDVKKGVTIAILKDWADRDVTAQELLPWFNQEMQEIPGALIFSVMPPPLGQQDYERPVQFVLQGSEYEELLEWSDLLVEKARTNPGLINVDVDYKLERPQINIIVDIDRAGDLGVSIEEVGSTLETLFGSKKLTKWYQRGKEYDVMVQADEDKRMTPEDLERVYVRSTLTNELIPITNVVQIQEVTTAAQRKRFDRLRAVTVMANLKEGYSLGDALQFLDETATQELPKQAQWDYKAQSREFKKSGSALLFSFGLALLLCYLIMAAQFESFIHPFVIITTVPLATFGALVGLYLWGQTLNVYSQIGLTMLIGLSTKNGILIVEFINQLRDEGVEFSVAILRACRLRLRPIMMTAISTIMGSIPLVLATGAGAESRIPMGLVIMFGVAFSTVMTLIVVPVIYSVFARNTESPETVARKLQSEMEEGKA